MINVSKPFHFDGGDFHVTSFEGGFHFDDDGGNLETETERRATLAEREKKQKYKRYKI